MRSIVFAVMTAAAAVCAGCDEKLSSITGPTPDLAVSFASIERSIFNNTDSSGRLRCTNCHTDQGRNPAGGLVLLEGRAYQQLVGRAAVTKAGETRVIPGDPDNSYLVRKLEGGPAINGVRMPFNTPPFLTEGQMRVIRQWIREGAPNN